jgi:hypothetical protein
VNIEDYYNHREEKCWEMKAETVVSTVILERVLKTYAAGISLQRASVASYC